MSWSAILPVKSGPDRKSRLATVLSEPDRVALSERMARHVLSCLRSVPRITRIDVLGTQAMAGVDAGHLLDEGRGLNAELTAARCALADSPLLIIHGDLPLVAPADIARLLTAAERKGWAIAPDRHGTGTNALALFDVGKLPFRFGVDSFAAHVAAVAIEPAIVRTVGLAHDIDTPEDFEAFLEAETALDR